MQVLTIALPAEATQKSVSSVTGRPVAGSATPAQASITNSPCW
jgi:hypothetical protein